MHDIEQTFSDNQKKGRMYIRGRWLKTAHGVWLLLFLFPKLTNTGTPLGILPEVRWVMQTVQVEVRDLLLLYTDGVTEAQNRYQEEFGEQRLVDHLQENQGATVAEIQLSLVQALENFADGAPRFDDVALMVLRRL